MTPTTTLSSSPPNWFRLQQAKAEQEEEFISNTLLKKIDKLKKEKETLAMNYEQEEEYLTNDLSRKLMQVRLGIRRCVSEGGSVPPSVLLSFFLNILFFPRIKMVVFLFFSRSFDRRKLIWKKPWKESKNSKSTSSWGKSRSWNRKLWTNR